MTASLHPRFDSAAIAPDIPQVQVIRLGNGLTVIYQPLPSAVVSVDVWVAAGARVDPVGYGGMAHFLEHLIFKGTPTTPPGQFDRLVEDCGGVTNASTGYDYAHYYITTAVEQLEAVLPTFADLLFHAAIPELEFERERQVVLEELLQAQDDPDWVGGQRLAEQVYGLEHPYGRAILGSAESLQVQSVEQLRQFHRHYYRPEHMTVVVAGGVGGDRVLPLIQTHFGQRTPAVSSPGATGLRLPQVPPCLQPLPLRRQVITLPQLEQARLLMAWRGPGVDQPLDCAGMDLLAAILAEGRLSRLIHELREVRGWVSDLYCDASSDRLGGLFTITAWLEPEYLASVEQWIRQELRQLQQQPVTPTELQRAQIQLQRDFIFSLEIPEDFGELYGYAQTVANLEQALDYPQWLQQWTPESLQQLAKTYLLPDQYCITLLCPEPVTEPTAESEVGEAEAESAREFGPIL